jgi:carboxylesterase
VALLLPGHGGCYANFARTRRGDWLQQVERAIDEARGCYRRVFLVGHSLGALLCLDYAARKAVDGLVLLNAPLRFRISPRQLALSLRVLLGKPRRDDALLRAYRAGFGICGGNPLCAALWVRPFWLLLEHIRDIRPMLERVTAPVLLAQSALDESVHPKSAALLENGLLHAKVTALRLVQSHHGYFPPADELALREAVMQFFAE